MSTTMRIFWLLTLTFFAGGCSTYKVLSPRETIGEPGASAGPAFPVKQGDEVRITQHDDGQVTGKVLTASPQGITVHVARHNELFTAVGDSDQNVPIPADAIRSLEKRCFSLTKSLALFLGIALPLVAVGASMESVDFSMESGNWGSPGP